MFAPQRAAGEPPLRARSGRASSVMYYLYM